jgi:hypothetical protein
MSLREKSREKDAGRLKIRVFGKGIVFVAVVPYRQKQRIHRLRLQRNKI